MPGKQLLPADRNISAADTSCGRKSALSAEAHGKEVYHLQLANRSLPSYSKLTGVFLLPPAASWQKSSSCRYKSFTCSKLTVSYSCGQESSISTRANWKSLPAADKSLPSAPDKQMSSVHSQHAKVLLFRPQDRCLPGAARRQESTNFIQQTGVFQLKRAIYQL